jgi:hypothetical protein
MIFRSVVYYKSKTPGNALGFESKYILEIKSHSIQLSPNKQIQTGEASIGTFMLALRFYAQRECKPNK